MRRTFPFSLPTLILCFFIQCLGSFLPCMFNLLTAYALAQAPITQSGLNTQVSPPVTLPGGQTQYNITGGTRPGGGANLFHSFGNFNVPNNNIANFLNDSALATSNILGRVTGGNPSNIFGTIQTTGFGAANLFLMNPAGIVFGPTASLNVGGSVSFTTADYLRLADGGKFSATPGPQDASISSAPVAAFGFLGSNPGAISVQGSQLSVTPGQSISLVGGNITVQPGVLDDGMTIQPAHLSAPGGQINLASVASPGEILTGTWGQAPNINGQSFSNLGTVQISEQSVIDASGDGGGTVLIRGGQLVLDNSTISANITGPGALTNGVESIGGGIDIQVSQNALIQNGALIDTSVVGNATPGVTYGGVHIKADQIEVPGSIVDLATGNVVLTVVQSTVAPDSTGGNSGDIRLEANSILVKDLGQVQTATGGAGNAGNIMVTANQNIEVGALGIGSFSILASGNAGNIELTSTQGNILIPAGTVTTQTVRSSGNAGSITLTAREGDVVLGADPILGPGNIFTLADRGTGAIGGIQIIAKNLHLNESSIEADTFFGVNPVKPGTIDVTLSGSLSLDGGSFITTIGRGPAPAADLNIAAHNVNIAGGSFLTADTVGSGPGGQLNISTNNLQLTNGGQVRSGSVIDPFPVPGETPPIPSGPAGTVTIQGLASPAQSVLIDGAGSGIFTNTVGTGAGGNTNMSAQSVTIQNGGTVSASTSGIESSATGGNISVAANQLVALNSGGSITASSTGPANAGNIAINGGSQFLSQNASVTTEATQASGGNIVVQATDSIRLVNSKISTSVHGGPDTSGGNITIDPTFMTLQNSQILAEAFQGQGGNINITAGTFLMDPTSRVSASSQFGLSGAVNIQSPVSMLSGSLATLPQRPMQVQHLLQQRCAAQVNGQLSSLVVAGRDTLPSEPGGWLMSSMVLLSDDGLVAQPSPLTSDDLVPSPQTMIVSGQLYERHTSSPQQGVTNWAAGCGS